MVEIVWPGGLPDDKRALLDELLDALRVVRGLRAVALGGSYARGTERPGSDVDIGLYYEEQRPFGIDAVRRVAERIATSTPVVTDFYQWGPWVNGGAWIPTRAGKVDFLYRNLDQLRRVIADAHRGKVELHFQQQPPFGFYSVIYLAEIQAALPLYDPQDVLAPLKRAVASYPAALKQTIVGDYLWGVEFTLLFARDFAARADAYGTVGCLARALSYLTQVLYALNEMYFSSDKGVLEAITTFPKRPPAYAERVQSILARPGTNAAELSETVAALTALFRDVVGLAGSLYRPKFTL